MMTAPTGQAVFDPFAPPPIEQPQSTVPSPVVADPITHNPTQQVVPSALQINDHAPAQVGVNPPNQPDELLDQTELIERPSLPVDLEQPDSTTSDLPDSDISSNVAVAMIDTEVPEVEDLSKDQDVQSKLAQSQDFDLTEDERIALFDEVLTEAEQSASVFDQVMPAAILANDPLNPQNGSHSSARKPETVASNSAQQEAGLIGQVEFEPSSELPVEVEGFLERVEDHADKLPQEIVVADGNIQALPQSHPTQTVIVLPITEEEGQAQVKDVKLSLAWLLEWSHKIIKQFVGKVVYRHESNI